MVIGAGPAGLTAGYELSRQGVATVVLEKQDRVGGLARTERVDGYYFDMGGHRFFTKSREVQQIWVEALGEDFLRRPRLSRIYYNRRFIDYPLKPLSALKGLGPGQATVAVLSYIRWRLFPYRREDTVEQWITNRFGQRLFKAFFKTYTEKVWGIRCSELRAEWAAQRIKDLSFTTAILSMFSSPGTKVKSLINEFDYPRRGPGMMWEAIRRRIEERGSHVLPGSEVVEVRWSENRVTEVVVDRGGSQQIIGGTDFITSMPISVFVSRLSPQPPPSVVEAASSLKYRDFLCVGLIVDRPSLFPDNWVYIHDPSVRVGRIQNYKNWSSDMVPDPSRTSLGLEYFCNEGDDLWSMSDAEVVELAKREVEKIGLARADDVLTGHVFRLPKAYPIYDSGYRAALDTVRQFLDSLGNLQTIGRNGLHRYNNQDHSMITGIMAARNLLLDEKNDLWSINGDQEYHEEERVRLPAPATDRAIPELDRVAIGLLLFLIPWMAFLVWQAI